MGYTSGGGRAGGLEISDAIRRTPSSPGPSRKARAMPTLATRRIRPLRAMARLALALTLVGVAASDASAQLFQKLDEHASRFYGPDYRGRGYADSLGLRGHKRCENGGYYGPPQLYSRQYGRIHGYRLDPPFAPYRPGNTVGFGSE